MLAATYLRPRLRSGRNATARRLGRRCLRPVRSLQHAIVGVMGLWAATAWSSEPDRPEKSTAAMADAANTAPNRVPVSHVIVLGDSISSGMGAESLPLSYASLLVENDDARYPEDAGQDLRTLLGRNIRFLNFAHEGDDTWQVLHEQLPKLFATLEAEAALGIGGSYLDGDSFVLPGRVVLLLTAGGNDVQRAIRPHSNFTGSTLTHSVFNLRTLLHTVNDRSHFAGGTSAYFASVYDVTDGEDQLFACKRGMAFPGISQALEVWNQAYGNLARQNGARLVDALGLFRGHGFNFDKTSNRFHDPADTTLWVYDRDCIHPNNLGHHMLRRAFLQQIERDFGATDGAASAAEL